ncbi:class I SAM-dependent methyltransferase [Micromonospora sp. IBHARD004]|uniref:class I SAM-dependent methyltransferase n=1 Tax=Micromonospora sp. IBHARD004 TaxID=3457764 RepID=UPI004059D3D8
MAPRGITGYAEVADTLARQYESVSFGEVHREVLHLFPERPSQVMDVGAGTGRDAAALSALGHRVVAVEPTAELRNHGRRLHPDMDIDWVDDALPDLAVIHRRGLRFDLILVTAVWMHLDRAERDTSMRRLGNLLEPGGQMILSVRHGPVPAGRRMYDVPARETIALAREYRLDVVHSSRRSDLHGRADVSWTLLGLRRPANGR